jgi:hypothetical protein
LAQAHHDEGVANRIDPESCTDASTWYRARLHPTISDDQNL